MGDDFHHRHTGSGGKLADLIDGRHAYFARRLVDDAAQPHIIARVDDDGQIAVDVLDLLAVKEALATHNAVRDARTGEIGFNGVGLSIHAVEHGVVLQARTLAQMLADDIGDMAGLVLLVRGRVVVDLFAVSALGPKGLALAAHIVFDNAVGGVQNICGRAIVLLKSDRFGAAEYLLKIQDVFNRSAAEFIDGLVIIADNADIVCAARKQPHQMELGHTGVLILIHNDIAEAVLVVFPRLGIVLQQPDSVEDQIIKIHRARRLQAACVGCVNFGDKLRLGVGKRLTGDLLGRHKLILEGGDLRNGRLDWQELIVDHQILVDLLDHTLLVIGIIDRKAFGKADAFGIAAQHPHAGGVEGGGVDIAAEGIPQHGAQTLLQFPCCLVRKGDGQYIPRPGRAHGQIGGLPGKVAAVGHSGAQVVKVSLGHRAGQLAAAVGRAEADDVGDAVDQHGGLAGACTCQNQQRAFGGKDSLPLHRVKPGKAGFDILIAQGEIFGGDVGHGKSFHGVFVPLHGGVVSTENIFYYTTLHSAEKGS